MPECWLIHFWSLYNVPGAELSTVVRVLRETFSFGRKTFERCNTLSIQNRTSVIQCTSGVWCQKEWGAEQINNNNCSVSFVWTYIDYKSLYAWTGFHSFYTGRAFELGFLCHRFVVRSTSLVPDKSGLGLQTGRQAISHTHLSLHLLYHYYNPTARRKVGSFIKLQPRLS